MENDTSVKSAFFNLFPLPLSTEKPSQALSCLHFGTALNSSANFSLSFILPESYRRVSMNFNQPFLALETWLGIYLFAKKPKKEEAYPCKQYPVVRNINRLLRRKCRGVKDQKVIDLLEIIKADPSVGVSDSQNIIC